MAKNKNDWLVQWLHVYIATGKAEQYQENGVYLWDITGAAMLNHLVVLLKFLMKRKFSG